MSESLIECPNFYAGHVKAYTGHAIPSDFLDKKNNILDKRRQLLHKRP